MGAVYATVADIQALRPLTAQEQQQAEVLLQYASDRLRVIGKEHGYDIDAQIAADTDYGSAVKFVTINTVMNALGRLSAAAANDPAASQATQSALGYSVTLTYANAGSVLWFGKNDLKDLGLLRQKYGALDLYGASGGSKPPPY